MLNELDGTLRYGGGVRDDSQGWQGVNPSMGWSSRKVSVSGEAKGVTQALKRNEQSYPAQGQASNNGWGPGGKTIKKQADFGEQTKVGYQQYSDRQALIAAFPRYAFRFIEGLKALELMVEAGKSASNYTEVMRFTCNSSRRKYVAVELDTGHGCLFFRSTSSESWVPFPGWFGADHRYIPEIKAGQIILDGTGGWNTRQYDVPIYQKIASDLMAAESFFKT